MASGYSIYSGLKVEFIDDTITPPGSPIPESLQNSMSIASGFFINSEGTSPWPDSPDPGSPTPRPDSPDPRLPPPLRRSFAVLSLDMFHEDLDGEPTTVRENGKSTLSKHPWVSNVGAKRSTSARSSISSLASIPSRPSCSARRTRTPFTISSSSECSFSSEESSRQESDWESRDERKQRQSDMEMQRRKPTRRMRSASSRAKREEELSKIRNDGEPIVPATQRSLMFPELPTDVQL